RSWTAGPPSRRPARRPRAPPAPRPRGGAPPRPARRASPAGRACAGSGSSGGSPGPPPRPRPPGRGPRPPSAGSPGPSRALPLAHVGEQGQLAGALDGERELLLVAAREARDPPRAQLAAVGDEAAQRGQVLVVDLLDVDARVLARARPLGAAAPARGCLLGALMTGHVA